MSSISSIGGGTSFVGVFGGNDPLAPATFGGSDPLAPATFGGSDPAGPAASSTPDNTAVVVSNDPAAPTAPVTTPAAPATFSGSDPAGPAATASPSAHRHHHPSSGISSKIETAVTSALQNAPQGTDPNQIVQNAIADVLKSSSGQTTVSSTGTSDAAGTDNTNFIQLLQLHNINPKQFKQDFKAAVQGIQQGGGVNFGLLFKGFPRGASVDATA